jgi:hypothetical protein
VEYTLDQLLKLYESAPDSVDEAAERIEQPSLFAEQD